MTVIKKLELIHFGKFCDTVIDLESGQNRFCEKNEWGKSTLADFIIYMLYGFKKTAKKSIELKDNLLKKYLPWSDDSYIFGAMELEHEGRHIRIERKTYATGRMNVSVCDINGAPLGITEPGQQLFCIDCNTFMRTFLVRQTDIAFDGTDDIETALKNLVTTGDEQTSFDAALKVITDKKNRFQHGERRSGRIFELPRLITDKRLEMSSLAAKESALSDSLLQYNSTASRLKTVQRTEKELEGKKAVCAANDAQKIVARAEQLLSESAEYSKKLEKGRISITEQHVRDATEAFNSAQLARAAYDAARAHAEEAADRFERAREGLCGIEYVKDNLEQITQHLAKKARINIPLIAVGVGICIMSVAAWPLAIVGAIVILLGIILKIKPKPIFDKTNEQLAADVEKYNAAMKDINEAAAEHSRAKDALEIKKGELDGIEQKVNEIRKKYNITELFELSTLLAQSKNAQMLSAHTERLAAELDKLLLGKSLDEYRELAKNADGSDLGTLELERMLAHTAEQKSECAVALARLEKARIECVELRDKINALGTDILALESELKDAEYQNRVMQLARDTLEQAYDKINSVYSPIVSQKISPYLYALTGGKYVDAVVDRQFNIRVKYKGEYKELGFFSRGTADAVYLAVRLAMAEVLEGQNKLPLVLDDPFWSFDKERLQNAENLINELAKSRQILVFCAK